MGIPLECACGARYDLKDEWAGKQVRCAQCSATLTVPPAVAAVAAVAAVGAGAADPLLGQIADYLRQLRGQHPDEALKASLVGQGYAPELVDQALRLAAEGAAEAAAAGDGAAAGLDPAFQRDKFLLRQKHFSISEKYLVWDEQGGTVLFVERPAHLLRNLAAFFGGAAAFAAAGYLLARFTLLGAVLGGGAAGFYVWFLILPKRHVTFFRDESAAEPLLHVSQDQKFAPFTPTYTVRDPQGEVLGVLRKNYLYNVFRKRWYIDRADGSPLCLALEDSVLLSLLRRFLGDFFGLLRTNFIITPSGAEDVIGEFNRKFTLLDRYVLDMSGDPGHILDRRVAVALGVMLDTGEKR